MIKYYFWLRQAGISTHLRAYWLSGFNEHIHKTILEIFDAGLENASLTAQEAREIRIKTGQELGEIT